MTEDEARKKWRPSTRVYNVISSPHGGVTIGSSNRQKSNLISGSFCIASKCMRWPVCKKAWEKCNCPNKKVTSPEPDWFIPCGTNV